MIADFDHPSLVARDAAQIKRLAQAIGEVGFLTLSNTPLDAARMGRVFDVYTRFFRLPEAHKQTVDMARTGANRGWGASQSEQVDPQANPDYKQVFDCGFELPQGHALADLSVYAPNQWPPEPPDFRETVQDYYRDALGVAMDVLRAIAAALGERPDHFDQAFDHPMALLRGNYYPTRPEWAGAQDFGIAAHTDYGCLTLLAMDGRPGLEVKRPDGSWQPVTVPPGQFVINFGEMLEMWTAGRARATEHRVIGSEHERISIPMFFNPNYKTNVAPKGAAPVLAGDHLSRRFNETYVHLQTG